MPEPTKGTARAAAAKPPITSAPSPPMIVRPSCAGIATVSAVRIRGAERLSVLPQEKAEPKPPTQSRSRKVPGDWPSASRNSANSAEAATTAATGMTRYSEAARRRSIAAGPRRGGDAVRCAAVPIASVIV